MAIAATDVNWSLSDIRTKVRRLSGRPSANQISDNDVDEYINRFYLQDLIAELDLREVNTWWTFDLVPDVAIYSNLGDNFALEGAAWVNGSPVEVLRDPSCFFERFPATYATKESVGTGDASTTTFTGSLSKTTVSAEHIVFEDSVEALRVQPRLKITNITQANPAVVTTDVAHGLTTGDKVRIVDLVVGMKEIQNITSTVTVASTTTFQLDNVNSSSFTAYQAGGNVLPLSVAILKGDFGGSGRVTLSSGAFSITFNTAPANSQAIRVSYEFSEPGFPRAFLYYDNELLVTPVPDAGYHAQMSIRGRPVPLLADTDALAFDDWGKVVAYGAAIDLLNDHMQQESAQFLQPEFRRLMSRARYKNIRETSDERSTPRF